MSELLDAYDADGRHLGAVPRDEVHRDGLWHDAFHLWVVLADEAILLQRRAPDKLSWPGHLDASAAGHLTAGEQVMDGLREADEELGVAFASGELEPFGIERVEDLTNPALANRERQHVFIVRTGRRLADFTAFDRTEVTELVAVSPGGFRALVGGGEAAARAFDGTDERLVTVRGDDLVPTPYLPALAERLAR